MLLKEHTFSWSQGEVLSIKKIKMTISSSMAYISRKLVTQKKKQSETWLWLIQQLASVSFRSHTWTVTLSVHVWWNNSSPECLSKLWKVTGAQLQEGWVGRAWVAANLLSLCGKCQGNVSQCMVTYQPYLFSPTIYQAFRASPWP